ncbi:DUF4321 domain-containing protein [Clostridium minihomine]|uniref:DUF4321 domain-containing protein n=1 Tax=Clostridium minihomine TaxID=2045012 RepID=UPI000C75DFE5|nr:DUF4321 domain-containing protein [Clostridium minihomine]
MKHNLLRNLFLIILLLLAVVLGKVIGTVTQGISFLSWLGVGANFGLEPVTVNLSVVTFTLGMMVSINVAQALLLAIAILIFNTVKLRG